MSADANVTIPEGHEVTSYSSSTEPGVMRTRGGIVLASFGVGGDDPDAELDAVLRDVDATVRQETPLSVLVNLNRQTQLSELFAPANPAVLTFRSPVSWLFHRGSLAPLLDEPRRLQALLRQMYRVSTMREGAIRQAAYIIDPPSPALNATARLFQGLGLVVMQPDDTDASGRVLLEVARPEGVVLCLPAGKPYPIEGSADTYARTINQEKDRADAAAPRERLEEQERAALKERVGDGEPLLLLRAARLRRIILELEGGTGQDTMKKLLTELLGRQAPLFFMKNPHDDGMAVRTYGAAGRALPMFADLRCIGWAAQDMQKKSDSFVTAGVLPRECIAMAAQGGLGVAICTYRDRATPVYAIVPAEVVKSVAKALSG